MKLSKKKKNEKSANRKSIRKFFIHFIYRFAGLWYILYNTYINASFIFFLDFIPVLVLSTVKEIPNSKK